MNPSVQVDGADFLNGTDVADPVVSLIDQCKAAGLTCVSATVMGHRIDGGATADIWRLDYSEYPRSV